MQLFLKTLSATFFTVFLLIFIISIQTPQRIEKAASGFIKKELKRGIMREMEDNQAKKAIEFAKDLGFEFKNKAFESQLERVIEEIVLFKISGKSREDYLFQNLFGNKKVNKMVDEKYEEVSHALKFDIQIFAGTNLLIFLTLFFFLNGYWGRKGLLLPASLIIISTSVSILIYLFGQDWIYVMLYNNYMGYGYLIYVSIVMAILLDIAYNKSRVTRIILESIVNILSSFG